MMVSENDVLEAD